MTSDEGSRGSEFESHLLQYFYHIFSTMLENKKKAGAVVGSPENRVRGGTGEAVAIYGSRSDLSLTPRRLIEISNSAI